MNERDDICESVVRCISAKDPTRKCFIGFENIVQGHRVHHDPTGDLLKRLADLRPRVLPLSRLQGLRVEDGVVVGYDHGYYHEEAVWLLWGISRISDGQATLLAVEGSTSYRFDLVHDQGGWTVLRDTPITYF